MLNLATAVNLLATIMLWLAFGHAEWVPRQLIQHPWILPAFIAITYLAFRRTAVAVHARPTRVVHGLFGCSYLLVVSGTLLMAMSIRGGGDPLGAVLLMLAAIHVAAALLFLGVAIIFFRAITQWRKNCPNECANAGT